MFDGAPESISSVAAAMLHGRRSGDRRHGRISRIGICGGKSRSFDGAPAKLEAIE
jgi:hypothetical protein